MKHRLLANLGRAVGAAGQTLAQNCHRCGRLKALRERYEQLLAEV